MRKSFYALILVVALLLSFSTVAAAEENTLSGGTAIIAVPGKTVLYPIYMASDAKIASCKLFVEADTTVFSLEYEGNAYVVKKGDVTKSGTLLANLYAKAGWQVNWFHTRNVSANGVFCWLSLKVAEDAELGTYPVKLSYSEKNTSDEAGNDVEFARENGTITVVSPDPTVYSEALTVPYGTVVDVPVYLRNNTGLSSFHLLIEECAGLQVVTDENGDPIITQGDGLAGGSFVTGRDSETGCWQILWFSTEVVYTEGVIATVRMKSTVPAGESIKLPFTYCEENTLGENYKQVPLKMQLASVHSVELSTSDEDVTLEQNTVKVHFSTNMPFALNKDEVFIMAAAYNDSEQFLGCATDVSVLTDGSLEMEVPIPVGADCAETRIFFLEAENLAPLAIPQTLK